MNQDSKDLADVIRDGRLLRFIKNQKPEICMAAVKNHGDVIYYGY